MIDFNSAAPQGRWIGPSLEERAAAIMDAARPRMRRLIQDIYPLCQIDGPRARIGSVDGERGQSLSIALDGQEAGLWHDWADATSKGDLISLWMHTQGHSRRGEAIGDLEEYLGLGDPTQRERRIARFAEAQAKLPKPPPSPKVDEIVYRYWDATGQTILGQVIRQEMADGTKRFMQRDGTGAWKAPAVSHLYNLPAIAAAPPEAPVILVEGEKAAEALILHGDLATTLPGGSNTDLAKADLTPLAGRAVILWPDADQPGHDYMLRLRPRLEAIGARVAVVEVDWNRGSGDDAADAPRAVQESLLSAAWAELPPEPKAALRRRFQPLSISDLEDAPPPSWLMTSMLPKTGLAILVAPSGGFKSFIALAWALSIASGRPWLGHDVTQGPVAYWAGEGQAGLITRIAAWRQVAGDPVLTGFHVIPDAMDLTTDCDQFVASVTQLSPRLVVIDTLARAFGAGDENSTRDMGAFIKVADRVREATGALVLLVHHTGKDLERGMRGSSALLGAADCVIGLRRQGPRLTVINKAPIGKQKEAEEFDDIHLISRRVEVTRHGQLVNGLVFEADESPIQEDEDAELETAKLGRVEQQVLAYLASESHEGRGLTQIVLDSGVLKNSAFRALHRLAEKGLIQVIGEGRARRWRVR